MPDASSEPMSNAHTFERVSDHSPLFSASPDSGGEEHLADTVQSRFLTTMSHELRTPLNAVLGYAGLLRDGIYGPLNDLQRRAVQSIVRRTRDLQLLVDDVLDLARIESGRPEVRADEFDPVDVVTEISDEIAPLARERDLEVSVSDASAGVVLVDRGKYKHLVMNLVSNAIKFTQPGGAISISLSPATENRFVTRVTDTGVGIPREQLEHIFEDFRQLHGGTTRRHGGMGIGLALVRRTVALLGGAVSVSSTEGQGTMFSVTLPVRPERGSIVGAVIDEAVPEQTPGCPIILAIDDDPEVIALLKDSLLSADYRVVGALNGDRGLELARILRPFAILLDILMPKKDGWQVLREIKADPDIHDIPVIVTSIISERAVGFSLGVTDYLVKPVDRNLLLNVLNRLRHRHVPRFALVADHDYDARILLCDVLESLGWSVRTCSNAEDAIRRLDEQVPDVLFLDLALPPDDIRRITEAVSREQKFEQICTVVVTRHDSGRANSSWRRRASAAVEVSLHPDRNELLGEIKAALATLPTKVVQAR